MLLFPLLLVRSKSRSVSPSASRGRKSLNRASVEKSGSAGAGGASGGAAAAAATGAAATTGGRASEERSALAVATALVETRRLTDR